MEFTTERFADIRHEIQPLLGAHWDEIACKTICGPLDVNEDVYRLLEQSGALHITTAREQGRLVGYAAYIVGANAHYKTRIMAEADVFYMHPSQRRGTAGIRLLKAAEAALHARGAHIIVNKVKVSHDVGPIFARMGYHHVENVWMKAV